MASKDLDRLLVDLKENPKRYVHISVFGKSDKSPKKKK
jgi:phospholipid/cholesterol/gamma-HCH transport system substrate-binding protein